MQQTNLTLRKITTEKPHLQIQHDARSDNHQRTIDEMNDAIPNRNIALNDSCKDGPLLVGHVTSYGVALHIVWKSQSG